MSVELQFIPTLHARIAVLEYEPRRARNVTLVAGHGYSSSKHNLDFLCAFLSSHGFRVLSLDFPGHKLGASGGRLDRFEDALAAMAAVADHALATHEAPCYTIGHSMGAMAALRVTARDGRLAGAIAIATGWGRSKAIDALQGVGAFDLRSSYVAGLTLPALVSEAAQGYEEDLARLAGRPVLFVAADRDMMVSRASVQDLYDRAPQPKTLRTIESDHTYAGEHAKAAVLAWLNELHPRG